MSFMITHFYEGGTDAQYQAVADAVHPAGGLPPGQLVHAAGPCDGGYLVTVVWESKEANDDFLANTLMPALPTVVGGLTGPPQERSCETYNFETA